MKITRFEDLECWQETTSLAIDIYKITSKGDFGKDYGLRDQLRRAAVSIAFLARLASKNITKTGGSMKVLILGADGYLGWPTCMYFSARWHEVIGVDNYFRRLAAMELNCEALITTPNLIQRAKIWEEISGKKIQVFIGDVTDYSFLSSIFEKFKPDTVIHYAEQPSAPYSMTNREKAAFTIKNNLISTLNLCYPVKEYASDCHMIVIS